MAVTNICLSCITFYKLNVSYVTTYIIRSDYYSINNNTTTTTNNNNNNRDKVPSIISIFLVVLCQST